MEFEWDKNKDRSNQKKHQISFDEAKLAFFDNDMIIKEDTRKNYGEQRFVGIGKTFDKIIVVVYTMRNVIIRLISARNASKTEKQIYHGTKN